MNRASSLKGQRQFNQMAAAMLNGMGQSETSDLQTQAMEVVQNKNFWIGLIAGFVASKVFGR